MDLEKCGQFICEKRKSLGLTQAMLGNRLGVSDKAVSNWERGKRFPDVELLEPLADALGTDVISILHGEDTGAAIPADIVELIKHERQELRTKWCMNLCFAVLLAVTICLVPDQLAFFLKSTFVNFKFNAVAAIICLAAGFFADRIIREPDVLGMIAYVLSMLWIAIELAAGLVIKNELDPGFLPFDARLISILPIILSGMLCSFIIKKVPEIK